MRLQLRVQLLLERQGFSDRFEHQVTPSQRRQPARRLDQPPDLRKSQFRRYPTFRQKLFDVAVDFGQRRFVGIAYHHRQALLRMNDRDRRAHHAGADDAHRTDLRGVKGRDLDLPSAHTPRHRPSHVV